MLSGKHSQRLAFAALSATLALATPTAHADLITGTSTLTQANTALGGGTGDFGTLSISLDNSTGIATFTFTGDNGFEFVDSNVADVNVSSSTFTFAAISTSPGGVTLTSTGPANAVDGFGSFTETTSIGNSSTPQTSITFSLTSTDFVGLTALNELLVDNGSGWDAAAHMCNFDSGGCTAVPGITGFVAEAANTFSGGGGGQGSVPEPGTLLLLGSGLVAAGLMRRRRA